MEMYSYGQNKKRLSPIPSPAQPSSPRLDANRFWHYTWRPFRSTACSSSTPPFRSTVDGRSSPRNPSCHATCKLNGNIYLFGGKDGNISYKDMWKYNTGHETWEILKCSGDKPFNLQGHSMTPHGNKIYVFGGQFNCGSDKESPFWIFNTDNLVWEKHKLQSDVMTPMSRREHTAVTHKGSLHVYGGYIDLKGSSSELWTFNFEHKMWHLSYCASLTADGPGGRHGHSAVVHGNSMWVFGGMNDLQAKDELWMWKLDVHKWCRIKCKGPPSLKDHSACVLADKMIIYGGTCDGQSQNQIWTFHLVTHHWSKVSALGTGPPGTVKHSALIISSTDINTSAMGTAADRCVSSPQLQAGGSTNCLAVETRRPFSSPPYVMEDGIKTHNRMRPVKAKSLVLAHSTDENQADIKLTVQFANPVYDSKTSGSLVSSQEEVQGPTSNPWKCEGQIIERQTGNTCSVTALEMKPLKGKDSQFRCESRPVRRHGHGRADWGSVGSVSRYTDENYLIDMKKSQTFSETDSLNSSFGLGVNNPTFTHDTQGQFIRLRRSSEVLSDDKPNNSQLPAKRNRYSSQFSDDFVPYHKSASAESILSTQSRHTCYDNCKGQLSNGNMTFSEAQAKSHSLGSLNSNFGGCDLTGGLWDWDSEPRSSSRDDLILEDIEDCDVDTIDQSQSLSNTNGGLTLMDCSPEEIDRSNYIFKKFSVKPQKKEGFSFGEVPQCTNQSLICLHDTDSKVPNKAIIQDAWARQTNTKADSRKISPRVLNKSELTAETQQTDSKMSDPRFMCKNYAPELAAQASQKPRIPNYNELFMKNSTVENKFYMFVIGGKTQEAQNLHIKPLSMWKLEIDIV